MYKWPCPRREEQNNTKRRVGGLGLGHRNTTRPNGKADLPQVDSAFNRIIRCDLQSILEFTSTLARKASGLIPGGSETIVTSGDANQKKNWSILWPSTM